MQDEIKKYVEELVASKLSKSEEKNVDFGNLFKSFSLGSTLEQTADGNVLAGGRAHDPSRDLAKAYNKKVFSEQEVDETVEILSKALFYTPKKTAKTAEIKEWKPTKEQQKNMSCEEIKWKLQEMKRLQEISWLAETEVPEVKDLLEAAYSKLKRQITEEYKKYQKAK